MSYICYTLRSRDPRHPNKTYTGITNNSTRRLRQHNGELVGGARSTRGTRPWTYFLKIQGLTRKQALSIEKKIHCMKRRNRRYAGLIGSLLCVSFFIDNRTIEPSDLIYCKLSDVSTSEN